MSFLSPLSSPLRRLCIYHRLSSYSAAFYLSMSDTAKTGSKRELSTSPSPVTYTKKARSQSPIVEEIGRAEENEKKTQNGITAVGRLPKGVKKYRKKLTNIEHCSHDDVHWREIIKLLGGNVVEKAIGEGIEFDAPFSVHEEVILTISQVSSNGKLLQIYRCMIAYDAYHDR